MSKGDKKNMGTESETKSCVLDIHFDGKTHFNLRFLIVVEKSITNKCQSRNRITWIMRSTPMLSPLGIYIEREVSQVTYRLNFLEQDLTIRRRLLECSRGP
jgi:hypothetical protein